MVSKALRHNMDIAKAGKKVWEKWIEEMEIKPKECVLLFPHADWELNQVFIKHLKRFKDKRSYDKTALLFLDYYEDIEKQIEKTKDRYFTVAEEQMEAVLKLYGLYEFSDRLIICSIDVPDGRMGRRMLEADMGYTLDEIVCAGIYRI